MSRPKGSRNKKNKAAKKSKGATQSIFAKHDQQIKQAITINEMSIAEQKENIIKLEKVNEFYRKQLKG